MNREQGARGVSTRIRERLRYANVMSTIAVFSVLAGGGAYAASQIGPKDIAKNAVRAKHIKKNQVKAKHVATNAVVTRKIRDGAVTRAKVRDGSLRLADLAVWQDSGGIGGATVNANTCQYFNFGEQPGAQLGDYLVVAATAIEPSGIILDGNLINATPPHGLHAGVCNNTAGNITLPTPFGLRIHGLR